MEFEDGIPRRQPPLLRAQSAQQVHKLVKKSTSKQSSSLSNYIPSRSCDDLNVNKSKSLVDLAVPACNSTMKIIDQMENLRFEQFEPVLTTTHLDHIHEQVDSIENHFVTLVFPIHVQTNKKLNYSNERIYKGLIDPNAEELVALAEQQEVQKRRQAAKFLVKNFSIQRKRNFAVFYFQGRISSIAKETC